MRKQWAARLEQEQRADFDVLPENWQAVLLFIDCGTQWRSAGMAGIPTGLDYAGVRAASAMMRKPIVPALFEDLQTMERAALAAWAEARR